MTDKDEYIYIYTYNSISNGLFLGVLFKCLFQSNSKKYFYSTFTVQSFVFLTCGMFIFELMSIITFKAMKKQNGGQITDIPNIQLTKSKNNKFKW